MTTYFKSQVAWFLSSNDPRWELSNMAGVMPIFWPLQRSPQNQWNSTEQLYQACKYSTSVMCLPDASPNADPSVRNRIRAQRGARGAKMTQKCAVKANHVRPDWEDPENIRLKAMLWVLELKLFWNPLTFGQILEKTGDQPIVEISTKDDFWGCKEFPGENHLGQLLMDIRKHKLAIMRQEFTYPNGLLLP